MARSSRPAVDEPGPDVAAVDGDDTAASAADGAQALPEAEQEPLPPEYPYVIATERLYVYGGARAHNPGDRVPAGNVERNGWADLVREPLPGE